MSDNLKKDCSMYISLKDSCVTGFNKWANAHQPVIKNDLGADNGLAATSRDHDNAVMTSLDRPHRPWLVPGAGTL
jgi:hypothetical protein